MAGAPDDEADLRVGLVAADAVDDVRAGFLERARPVDVALLVEARRELHQHGHLLVLLGRALQARDDRRSDARAVQRLLDRQDVGIVGGLRQERHHRVVRFVRMQQQQVAFLQHRKQIGVRSIREHVNRLLRRIAQAIEPRQIHQPHQDAQIERSRDDVDVFGRDVELIAEQRDQLPPMRPR